MRNDDICFYRKRERNRNDGSAPCLSGQPDEDCVCEDDTLFCDILHQSCNDSLNITFHSRCSNVGQFVKYHSLISDISVSLACVGTLRLINFHLAGHGAAHLGDGHVAPDDDALRNGFPFRKSAFGNKTADLHRTRALVHRGDKKTHDYGNTLYGCHQRIYNIDCHDIDTVTRFNKIV